MRYSKDGQINDKVRELVAAGWSVQYGRKHPKVVSPDGRLKLVFPTTPSCSRAGDNFEALVKRVLEGRSQGR